MSDEWTRRSASLPEGVLQKARAARAFQYVIHLRKSGGGCNPGAQKKWTWSGMRT